MRRGVALKSEKQWQRRTTDYSYSSFIRKIICYKIPLLNELDHYFSAWTFLFMDNILQNRIK